MGGCKYSGSTAATCIEKNENHMRVCCCLAAGEDATTKCPVEAGDCDTAGATWFNTGTGICEPMHVPSVAPYTVSTQGSNVCDGPGNGVPLPYESYRGISFAAIDVLLGNPIDTTASVPEASGGAYPSGLSTEVSGSGSTRSWHLNYGAGTGIADRQMICSVDYAYNEAATTVCPLPTAGALYVRMTTSAECAAAAKALGLMSAGGSAIAKSSPYDYPQGCSFKTSSLSSAKVYFNTLSGSNTATGSSAVLPICTKSDYHLGAPGSNACTSGARILVNTECQGVAIRTGFTVRVTRTLPRARARSLAPISASNSPPPRVSRAFCSRALSLPSLCAVECDELGQTRWVPSRSINVHGLL